MVLIIEKLDFPDENWDNRVERGGGDIYQTTTYAKFQEECLGMKTHYIIVKNKNKIIGQLMLNSGPRFAKYLKKRSPKLKNFFEKNFMIYTSIRGPIILNQKEKIKIYELIIEEIEKLARKGYAIKDFSLPIKEDEKIYNLFYEKKFHSNGWGTILMDLSESKEKAFSNIGKNMRKKLRKVEKENIIIKEATTTKEYKKIIKVIQEMEKRKGIYSYSTDYYLKLFKIFNEKEKIKTLYCEYSNKILATASIYYLKDKAARALVAHSNFCQKQNIDGMAFIEWEIIKKSFELGCKEYDFTSIMPKTKDPKEEGINFYKRRWGGKEIHYPYFSKEYSLWKKIFIKILIKTVKKRYQ